MMPSSNNSHASTLRARRQRTTSISLYVPYDDEFVSISPRSFHFLHKSKKSKTPRTISPSSGSPIISTESLPFEPVKRRDYPTFPRPQSPTTQLSQVLKRLSVASSDSTVVPDTPDSFTFRPSEAELQRRRLEKLARTFGEEVPIELVMGNSLPKLHLSDHHLHTESHPAVTGGKSNSKRLVRRASISLSTFVSHMHQRSELPAKQALNDYERNTREPFGSAHMNEDAPRHSTSFLDWDSVSVSSPLGFSAPSPPPKSSFTGNDEEFADEVATLCPPIVVNEAPQDVGKPGSPDPSLHPARPDTPFLDSLMPPSGVSSAWNTADQQNIHRRERRQGWSGEWNQPDIQDVISKLRYL